MGEELINKGMILYRVLRSKEFSAWFDSIKDIIEDFANKAAL